MTTRSMQQIWIRKYGGPEVLEVREAPDPEPEPGQVRVRARAVGLNFAEISARQGLYPDAPKPPCVVGYEGAGVVDWVGEGVTRWSVGDRVVFASRFGGQSEAVCVGEDQLFRMPASMSFEDGAAMLVNYLTAYHMLFVVRRIRPGDTVLIHSAAGGVGTAVLQLCATVEGVTTIGTASAGKHDFARIQGAHHVIDYRTEDYVAAVKKLTSGRGVDVVLDPLGGPDWRRGYSLLAPGGILVAFGLSNASGSGKRSLTRAIGAIVRQPLFNCMTLMNDNRAVAGVNMGHLWDDVDFIAREADALVRLYSQGKIKPHIGAVFPFSQVAAAHAELEQGRNVGKIVLVPDRAMGSGQ
ncbi:MAG TPA: medium chain dehydrogenase/reductase family protein [Polyangiaceae bacterium]|jgi:NADPH:quinone reductase-like Zn-dependent oxidoreductase|nr:medium chain dehydrogenase/reductase family protein [Polyangiaceae bacterium]